MGECDLCSGDESLPFTCNHCSGRFCSTHRLPEAHNCPALRPESPRPVSINASGRETFWFAIGVMILPVRLACRALGRAWSLIPLPIGRQSIAVLALVATIVVLFTLATGAVPTDTDAGKSVGETVSDTIDGVLSSGSEAVDGVRDGGDVVSERVGPPKTENPIKELEGDGFLKTFTLYESGAARLEFEDDYSCYERIAVGDTSTLRGNYLEDWVLPRDGELVVDMKGAVSKTKDPSNTFWLGSLTSTDRFCFGGNRIGQKFTVPEDWVR